MNDDDMKILINNNINFSTEIKMNIDQICDATGMG